MLSKVSNAKEREAVDNALGLIIAKLQLQMINSQTSPDMAEMESKYKKLQAFNQSLIERLKSEKEKAAALETQGKDLQTSIETKEEEIKAESERITALQAEIEKLTASQERLSELETQAT